MVTFGLNIYFKVSHMPESNSTSRKERAVRSMNAITGYPLDTGGLHQAECGSQPMNTRTPDVSTNQPSDNGRNTFQPSRIS